eukprot:COSAG01_NODE_1911_length_8925_cov_151.747111_5_plen_206_part_00
MVATATPRKRFRAPAQSPALIAVVHVQSVGQAVENAQRAQRAGLDGVFLINHGNSTASDTQNADAPAACSPADASAACGGSHESSGDGHRQLEHLHQAFVAVKHALSAGFFVGVNAIQLESAAAQVEWAATHCADAAAVWVDGMGVEAAELVHERVGFGARAQERVKALRHWKALDSQPPALQGACVRACDDDGRFFRAQSVGDW